MADAAGEEQEEAGEAVPAPAVRVPAPVREAGERAAAERISILTPKKSLALYGKRCYNFQDNIIHWLERVDKSPLFHFVAQEIRRTIRFIKKGQSTEPIYSIRKAVWIWQKVSSMKRR